MVLGTSFGRTISIKEPTRWERFKDAVLQQDWGSLRALGNSKSVKSNMLWIFLIPLAAKVVFFIRMHHEQFGLFGTLARQMQLPFSWTLLFLASLSFAVGSLIFIFRCPRLIKDVESYGEFVMQGRSDIEVRELFLDYLNYHERATSIQIPDSLDSKVKLQEFLEFATGSNKDRPPMAQLNVDDLSSKIYWQSTIANKPEAFKMMWDELRRLYPYARCACSISYVFGFICLSIIFCQNVFAVFQILVSR